MSPTQGNETELNASSGECFMQPLGRNIGGSISSAILLIYFIVGFPMHLWVVWLICKGPTKTLSAELLHAMWIIQPNLTVLSVLFKVLVGTVWLVRPALQCCICLDHYVAVVHPQLYLRLKPLRYKMMQSLMCWSIHGLVTVTKIFKTPFEYELIFLVPALCTFLYCYFSVLVSLRRPRPGAGERARKTSGDKLKIKAIRIILVNMVSFVVNYVPITVIFYSGVWNNVTVALFQVFSNVGVACGLVQPIHYLYRSRKLSCFNRAKKN